MKHSKLNLGLLTNKEIFETIHNTKEQFKELYTDLSNGLENSKLTSIYASNKGVKISMGNELQKCPYQVLDIFRDFDKKKGHNIRILNWWGHGLYIFVFFGRDLATDTIFAQKYFKQLDFNLAEGSSPWDYAGIVDQFSGQDYVDEKYIEMHIAKFGYLQWFKEIPLEADMDKLLIKISDQLNQIFNFHRI